MLGASGEENADWGDMLDRLSACITPEEAVAVSQAAVDRGSPSHVINLHNLVAGLLVKHGLTTWPQLHTSFPGYSTCGSEAGGGGEGQPCSPELQRSKEQNEARGEGDQSEGSGTSRSADGDLERAGIHDPSGHASHSSRERCNSGCHRSSADKAAAGKKRRSGRPPAAQKSTKQSKAGAKSSPGGVTAGKITLADYPRAVSWWHPTKNGDKLPKDYIPGSTKRVWLQCPGCPTCGEVHEWQGKACTVSRPDFGCPSCIGRGGSPCSCRVVSANERLAAEWHEDNPPPNTIALGSGKKYKWRCSDAACGHVWAAKPDHRNGQGSNCPACSIRKSCKGWKHPSVAVMRPELLAEWDAQKNTLLPTEVTCGSNKRVWWLCQMCGNSWQASVQRRALNGGGCPKRH